MTSTITSAILRTIPALAILALVMAGCRSATSPERHVRPSGVVATANGAEVVRVEGTTVTGSFAVAEGGQTDLLTFTFLDAQGNIITQEADYHLELRFDIGTVASFQPQGSPYTFQGRIHGLQAGATTVQIRFMHGPPGHVATHAEYTSQSIPLQVN